MAEFHEMAEFHKMYIKFMHIIEMCDLIRV